MSKPPVQHITSRHLIGPIYEVKRVVMQVDEILFKSRDTVALSLHSESATRIFVVEAMAAMDGHPNLMVVYLRGG